MKDSFKKLQKNSSYVCYWFATAFSMGASNVLQFALALYVLEMTGSSGVYASILSIIVIPRILLTPIAGVIGDRRRKIELIKSLNFITVIIMAIFSIYSYYMRDFQLLMVYLLVIILEIIEVFYQAAESSILPEIIDKELLGEAATLAKIDDGIVYITTPLLGALLYKNFGITGSFIAVACLLAVATFLNIFIKTPNASPLVKHESSNVKQYWVEFKEGIEELKKDKFIKNFVFISPVINLSFSAVFNVVITFLLLEIYGTSEYIYGLYRAITASMVLIVPLLVLPIVKKCKTEVLLKNSSLIISICIFLIAVASYIGINGNEKVQVITIFVIAFLDCITIASVMPLHLSISVFYQKNIKDEYRSRIMSVSRMLSLSSIPIGSMFYGLLTDRIPIYYCLAIGAVGVFIVYPYIKHQFREEII